MADLIALLSSCAGAAGGEEPDPYFNYTTLLLPGDGTNGAQNNTFLDSSTNNFTITRNGNTTQGTFSPFSQTGWSYYFDGSGDYINTTQSATFSSDYTIEAWVYYSNNGTYSDIVQSAGADAYIEMFFESTTNVLFLRGPGNSSYAGGSLIPNAWNHVAIARSGTTISYYANGTRLTTKTSSATPSITGLYLGRGVTNTEYLLGYISNFRIVNGTSLYSGATITVPTSPLTAVTNTSLLTCQSNRFKDNSTNNFTITVNGNSSVQAFSPFAPTETYDSAVNGGSMYNNADGDYLTVGTGVDISSSESFTAEAWVYPLRVYTGSQQNVFGGGNGTNTQLYYSFSSDGSIGAYVNGGTLQSGGGFVKRNTWNHLVWCRDGSTLRLFVNGVLITSGSVANNCAITSIGYGGGLTPLGYISGARVLRGTALYTSAFTPPTAPPTAISNTQLLCNFTNAGITDATAKNDLQTAGNAQISTAQSKFGGGSMYFDGTGDYLLTNAPTKDLFAFGTGDFTIEFWVRYANTTGIQVLYDGRPSGTQGAYPTIYSDSGTIYYYANTGNRITGSTLSSGTWYHIAVSRSGTATKMFVDGTQVGSTYTDSTNYLGVDNRPSVGDGFSFGTYPFNGYIDDLRVTKGIARYTANFTPPTKAFPVL